MDENGQIYNLFEPIETHTCTKEELGLTDDENPDIEASGSSFFKLDRQSFTEVNLYKKKFRCIDGEDMHVSGDYNSEQASLLLIKLNRCDRSGAIECKDEEEILEFFSDKFLILLINERLFN